MRHLLALLVSAQCFCALAQDDPQLHVTGVGRIEVPPDVAAMQIDLKAIRMEFTDAVSALESDYQQMVKHLENEGFKRDDIKTSDYGVRPNMVHRDRRMYDSGFYAYHQLRIELANTKENLAKTMKALSKSPVKARLKISFTVSDSLQESIKNELIKKAIKDAQQKARLMAETSGQQLGNVVKITYNTGASGRHFSDELYDISMNQAEYMAITEEDIVYFVEELSFEDDVMMTYSMGR